VAAAAVACRAAGLGGMTYNPFAGLPAPEFSSLGASLALVAAWPALRLLTARPQREHPAALDQHLAPEVTR